MLYFHSQFCLHWTGEEMCHVLPEPELCDHSVAIRVPPPTHVVATVIVRVRAIGDAIAAVVILICRFSRQRLS